MGSANKVTASGWERNRQILRRVLALPVTPSPSMRPTEPVPFGRPSGSGWGPGLENRKAMLISPNVEAGQWDTKAQAIPQGGCSF